MKKSDTAFKELLLLHIGLLQKSVNTFLIALQECKAIGVKGKYSYEGLKSFDSLTSKFARTSDIFTQKVLRSLLLLLRESTNTFIDMCNKAEKIGIIESADKLLEIRDLRNQIAHEYLEEQLTLIFSEVLSISDFLLNDIRSTKEYMDKFLNN